MKKKSEFEQRLSSVGVAVMDVTLPEPKAVPVTTGSASVMTGTDGGEKNPVRPSAVKPVDVKLSGTSVHGDIRDDVVSPSSAVVDGSPRRGRPRVSLDTWNGFALAGVAAITATYVIKSFKQAPQPGDTRSIFNWIDAAIALVIAGAIMKFVTTFI